MVLRDLWDFAVDMSPVGLLCVVLPLLCVLAPVEASSEFPVHRLSHYELGSSLAVGSKVSFLSLEARSLSSVPNVLRKLVVAPIQDVSISKFNELVQSGIGGLLLVVGGPESPNKDESVLLLEEHLLSTSELEFPIYFAEHSEDLARLMDELSREGVSPGYSAFQTLLHSILGSGYQLVTSSSSQPKALAHPGVVSFHGMLSGRGDEDALPTILLVAHYDAHGAAPGMSYGADSNGSGVAILLELARLWSKLYSSSRTHPGYNLLFLLSGGGKINFFGTKKWLEEHQDNDLSSEILSNVAFVACLDSLGQDSPQNTLHVHVSKPPREDSPAGAFFQHLRKVGRILNPQMSVEVVHKKINLAEEMLAWEHERFSIRRLPAFTLSALPSHSSLKRNSILDREVSHEVIHSRTRLIAEALACSIYAQCNGELFSGDTLSPRLEPISTTLNYLTSSPRATSQLLHNGKSSSLEGSPRMLTDLGDLLKSRSQAFKTLISKRDKREAEFTFYDAASTTMNAYRVKPAVFDLFLTLSIGAYLGILYLILNNMGSWITALKMANAKKSSSTASTPVKSESNGHARLKAH
eukprot:TRINITY_DN4200_c0_g1_i1.p1 TRINITY_DN4200_c0_g1~~TRINITY_DN4200_c0_g1_i1.p1  ORF type:complete len:610 (+),score=178.76 TRINITY_DN4200_c0_g1_i1:88-1830(+)